MTILMLSLMLNLCSELIIFAIVEMRMLHRNHVDTWRSKANRRNCGFIRLRDNMVFSSIVKRSMAKITAIDIDREITSSFRFLWFFSIDIVKVIF